MKRKIVSILIIGVLAASLAACGSSSSSDSSSDSESTSSSSGATSDDENTLVVYAWDTSFNIPALEAAAADYQANVNEDFVLEIVEQSGSSDIETLITTVASDTSGSSISQLPDIVLFQDHYIQQYVSDYPDVWQTVDYADVDWDSFAEEKLDYSTIDGVHYGMPVDSGTCIAAYRVDLLAEAGYTIDDLTGVTWDEFIEIGEDVYEATGKYLLCMDGDGNDLFYIMLQAEGISQFSDGEPYITENDTLVEIVDILVEMVERNVLYLTNDWDEYTNTAIQGDMVAGVINGNWIIPTIENVEENSGLWEITTLPTLSGAEGYASNGGSSLYITANCSKTELAEDFLSYTFGGVSGTTTTYDNALLDGGVVSTYLPASESDVYNEGVEYFNNTAIYAQIAEWTANVPVVEQSSYHYTCRTYMAAALVNVINGTDVATALEDAESQLRFDMGLN